MDIVDAQLHIGPGSFEPHLYAMDALGIATAVIEEFWVRETGRSPVAIEPGYALPNGAWRAIYPVAQLASTQHADRFCYIVRLDRRDPDLAAVMRAVASEPGGRGFRVLAAWSLDEAEAFTRGGYESLFDLAEDIGLPICVFAPGFAEHLPRYLRRNPKLHFVLDHCGMGMGQQPPGRGAEDIARVTSPAYFDEVLRLAEHPNLSLKLSHAPMLLGAGAYPYDSARAGSASH